ncbi:MAG: hypothetical protein R6V07_18095 [Armatimonadota bacterium]
MTGASTQKRIFATLAALLLIVAMTPAAVRAASMEIWPSERRANNTFYCYGDDWNWMLLSIYPEDWGKHRVELPEEFVEPTVLTVTLPDAVEFHGANIMRGAEVSTGFEATALSRDGRDYQQIRIPLPNDRLHERLIRGGYYFHVLLWFTAPETLDDTVEYELSYGDRELAAGDSRLLTAGVIDGDRELPERFGFYPYGIHHTVPGADYDRMADFWSRFGISGMEAHWTAGLPSEDDEPTRYHLTFEANRRHGINNIANMTLFGRKHASMYGARPEEVMEHGGLAPAMDEAVEGLRSEEALADWEAAHGHFDMALFDWEPTGPHIWPGYDDPATIAAFAESEGLAGDLTAEEIKENHREAYARFRMEQIARPLYAMRDTIDAVEPIPLRIEQGSGSSSHIDYDVYGHDFPAITPMIYRPSPLGYARNLLETLANTDVPSANFWPDMTIGWSRVGVHRSSPEEYVLDTVVTAAAGCGSVSHWPNMPYCDAAWFGIHEGLARIAMVEEFYLDGAQAEGISLEGVPYREETIQLGNRTLEHSAPDWRASLITFAHQYDGEQLLTLMNYHRSEACFVRVDARDLSGRYLVNPVEGVYQTADGAGRAMVEVAPESPGLWIATDDERRIDGCEQVDAESVEARFATARETFLESDAKAEIQLGTVGDITTAYGMTQFGGEERVTLQVRTPEQTLSFGDSGGRVYAWDVEGMESFVAADDFGTDGVAMDMLWLPASARWSGDEVDELTLVECSNDGREARVVYEGAMDKGAPGILLRKTFRVAAEGTTLGVEVTLRNDRVDQEPATLAYWSHNVLSVEQAHLVGSDFVHETERGVTTVLQAEGLPEELEPEVLMRDKIIGATGPAYAEYLPERNSGLIFRLPDNFMNVYRWSHYEKVMCGSEWMSQPLSIPAGGTSTLSFSITAVPEATPEMLQDAVEASGAETTTTGGDGNLLPWDFGDLDEDGLPAGWSVDIRGENADAAEVSLTEDEDGDTIVTATMPREATVYLDTERRMSLDPADDYMLAVEMKVDELHYTGDWYRRPAGVRVYVYGTDNKHTWLAVHGEGSTDGWVTAVLPFPPDDDREHFANSRILLRCYNMTGTVAFRNPVILRRPAGLDIAKSFELGDGTQISGGQLQLHP